MERGSVRFDGILKEVGPVGAVFVDQIGLGGEGAGGDGAFPIKEAEDTLRTLCNR